MLEIEASPLTTLSAKCVALPLEEQLVSCWRGCWHPLSSMTGLPFGGELVKPGQALVVCTPQAASALLDLRLPPGDHLCLEPAEGLGRTHLSCGCAVVSNKPAEGLQILPHPVSIRSDPSSEGSICLPSAPHCLQRQKILS